MNNVYTYLLLICIYMECLCFELEFGHLVPEFETQRDKTEDGQTEKERMRHTDRRQSEKEARERRTNNRKEREMKADRRRQRWIKVVKY